MTPGQPLRQASELRMNTKPGIVISSVRSRLEMADLRNKQDDTGLLAQTPLRTWCLAAILCLVASITIVCTTLWATSLISLSSVSTHHLKTNQSEMYNDAMMKEYIARRYQELGMHEQDTKTVEDKVDNQKVENVERKVIDNIKQSNKNKEILVKESETVGEISTNNRTATPSNHKSFYEDVVVMENSKLINATGELEGQVTLVSKQEFTSYAKDSDQAKIDPHVKLNISILDGLQELFGGQPAGTPKFPDYGPDSYFYSEYDANSYYSDYDEKTWTAYILEKIQELHDWITSDFRGVGKRTKPATIPQILEALNITLLQGDISVLILKLKDLYVESAQLNLYNNSIDPSRGREILTNTSSATSFGLLALDILLLRNLHLLMWDNQRTAIYEMMKDSELFAMNALFMESEQVRRMYEMLQKTQNTGQDSSADGLISNQLLELRESLTSHFYSISSLGHDIIDFTFSIIRAAANLGRAYRISRFQKTRYNNFAKVSSGRENGENTQTEDKVTELDCMWTVYCHNLQKATRNPGIFGFLAKLNNIGLRLIIGEVRIERLIDVVIQETFGGSKPLHCDSLFPRCNNKNAAKIVIEGIIGLTPNVKQAINSVTT